MKKWWVENHEEFLAGVFLVALFLFATVVLLNGIDQQEQQRERRISLMWRG